MDGLTFANTAELKCGMNGSSFKSKFNLPKNNRWSAAFVSGCADECGVLNTVVPNCTLCEDFRIKGLNDRYVSHVGTWIPQSDVSEDVTPEAGDVILLSWSSNESSRADSCGVVKGYNSENRSVRVVIGDYGNLGSTSTVVRLVSYSIDYSCIKGYFRPSWNEVQ